MQMPGFIFPLRDFEYPARDPLRHPAQLIPHGFGNRFRRRVGPREKDRHRQGNCQNHAGRRHQAGSHDRPPDHPQRQNPVNRNVDPGRERQSEVNLEKSTGRHDAQSNRPAAKQHRHHQQGCQRRTQQHRGRQDALMLLHRKIDVGIGVALLAGGKNPVAEGFRAVPGFRNRQKQDHAGCHQPEGDPGNPLPEFLPPAFRGPGFLLRFFGLRRRVHLPDQQLAFFGGQFPVNAADGVSRLIQPDVPRLLRFRPEKGPDCQMRRRFFRRLLPVRAQDETAQRRDEQRQETEDQDDPRARIILKKIQARRQQQPYRIADPLFSHVLFFLSRPAKKDRFGVSCEPPEAFLP